MEMLNGLALILEVHLFSCLDEKKLIGISFAFFVRFFSLKHEALYLLKLSHYTSIFIQR